MYKFAIGELGLRPWEFKDMTLNEYQITAHGYFLRQDRRDIGMRKLYVLQYNSKVKKGKALSSLAAIRSHWPLLTDPKITDILSKEEIDSRFAKARALTASQKKGKAHVN